MIFRKLRNQLGAALISTYIVTAIILVVSIAAYEMAFAESRHLDREIDRVQTYAAADAGLQNALAQIGLNAFTGFINTAAIGNTTLQSAFGVNIGTYSVTINYPNQADWIVLSSQATVNNETRSFEGRVFLDSNLSKYLIYTDTPSLWLGQNLVFGAHDGVNPEGVPGNTDDRAATYHTGDLVFSGGNVQIYGDVHVEDDVTGNSTSTVHGDSYVGDFATNASGDVIDDGISGGLNVLDGFADDPDRNGDGFVNGSDFPDRHDLTASGAGDSHMVESLDNIDLGFYQANNSLPAFNRGYGTGPTKTRYLVFEPNASGTQTEVIVYRRQRDFDDDDRSKVDDQFFLPANAILYNKGDLHVKGEIAGRISVVSSDDIFFDGNIQYFGGGSYCSSAHSAAFLASDRIYLRPENLEVSGILYADRENSWGSLSIDSNYNVAGDYAPWDKYSGHLRIFGNLIMDGTANTSNYTTDRAFVYDPNLKYFRPPGIPVVPDMRMVREL